MLIFDCDGVVVDSVLLHAESEALYYQKLGFPVTQESMQAEFSGTADADMIRILESRHRIKVPASVEADLFAIKKKVFAEKLRLIKGIEVVRERLAHIPHALASSAPRDVLLYALKLVGMHDFFAPHIYSADMVAHGKPAPDLFLLAAERLGQDPTKCIVIEDSVEGVKAGKAAGSRVVGFVGGSHCKGGHAEILRAAGADVIFHDMGALVEMVGRWGDCRRSLSGLTPVPA